MLGIAPMRQLPPAIAEAANVTPVHYYHHWHRHYWHHGGYPLAGCVIPQTARDIKPEVKIEQVIPLIAILLSESPDKSTMREWYSSVTRPLLTRDEPRRIASNFAKLPYWAKTNRRLPIPVRVCGSCLRTGIRRPRRTTCSEHNAPTGAQTTSGRSYWHHTAHTP